MTSFSSKIVLLFLTFVLAFSLISCGEEPQQTPTPEAESTQKPPTPEPIYIVNSYGECNYVIVYDHTSGEAASCAYALREKIYELCSVTVIATPSNLYSGEGNEIIIGADSMLPSDLVPVIDAAEDYYYFYYYGVHGSDLIMYANSEDAYDDMIQSISASFIISRTFSLPANYSRLERLTMEEYLENAE